ncbi:MAG TPA: O-antigen ligase family protein [Lacisediminihabitans sp.]|uniref:O-antigen ligase family protein n=1 Tax=Lacisediminihabitans sp. TaxID=2787631 RepID=UPI002ED827BE
MAVVGGIVGVLSAQAALLALALAVTVLAVGVSCVEPRAIPVLAIPACLVMTRVIGIVSVSDVVLAAATAVSLFLVRGRMSAALRPLLWSGTVYLAVTVPTLILNPYAQNLIEWVHEVVLVLGGMVVGYAVGLTGAARAALSSYVILSAAIGVVAAVVAVLSLLRTGAFQPVYLPSLHKNFIGGSLATAAVIAAARPPWIGWRRRTSYLLVVLCILGVVAAQSRQGLVALVVGFLILTLRFRRRAGSWSRLVWLLAIPVMFYVVGEVNTQLASDNLHNSAHQRLTWFSQSVDVWLHSPVFGVGMRWWYTDRFPSLFQPPNAEFEVLTTTGVVGLVGFLVMFAGGLWVLAHLDPVYGTVGLAVVLTRFVQAQFDLYWVAGQASLLWIVAGICIGMQARDRARADPAMWTAPPGRSLTRPRT